MGRTLGESAPWFRHIQQDGLVYCDATKGGIPPNGSLTLEILCRERFQPDMPLRLASAKALASPA
jgi:hypothetical protein